MPSFSSMKKYLMAKGLEAILPRLSDYSPNTLIYVMDKLQTAAINRMVSNHKGDERTKDLRVEAARGFFEMAKRKLPQLSSATQKKLCFNLFYNALHHGDAAKEEYKKIHGEYPPFFILISPTMACNLRCIGCYAWKYDKTKSLSFETLDGILTEAKEKMGMYFMAFTGGEPTTYKHLFPIVEKHNDMFFMMYTHGHNIDDAMAKKLGEIGNVFPAISVEGGQKETDQRRGPGAYQKVIDAMKRLRDNGVLFGVSVTHTRLNSDCICDGAFFDDMLDAGAAFGWVFQYIPFGKDPNLDLMPTAEQRYKRIAAIQNIRRKKPLLLFDFWNDGESVEGCIAWGRKYFHITSAGDVEPCVFCHFTVDNIHDKSLVECINSPVFKEARSRQPWTDDLRRPCPVIDHPQQLKELVEMYGMHASDSDGMNMVTQMHGQICQIAQEYKEELSKMDAITGGPNVTAVAGGGCNCGSCNNNDKK